MNPSTSPVPAFTLLQPLPRTAVFWKDSEISYADLLPIPRPSLLSIFPPPANGW